MVRESESTSGSAGITHQSDLWHGEEISMINLGPNESGLNSGWGDGDHTLTQPLSTQECQGIRAQKECPSVVRDSKIFLLDK